MHVSVLPSEAIELLHVRPDGLYVDATAGAGGHSEEILKRLDAQGRLIAADCDPQAVKQVEEKFRGNLRIRIVHARFSELFEILRREKLTPVNGILADLGISSLQLDDAKRGIAFMQEGPLDMRLDPRLDRTAADLIEELTEEELADLVFQLGGERRSRRLARAIVTARGQGPVTTTTELRRIAERALGKFYRKGRIHSATRLFQALRLAVNRELEELDGLLKSIPEMLAPGGRAAIISFHSLEDRKVKQKFAGLKKEGWNLITKRPVIPSEEEVKNNPRSRSAKLRVIERV